jgi:predicted XRE-type DNA-binding protein
MISKAQTQTSAARFSGAARRAAFRPEKPTPFEAELSERWNSQFDDARKRVAAQIVESLKSKWGTAVALEAATGICQTEMSRIRHGKIDRFSLERLVRLLWIVDPDVEVGLKITVVAKSGELPPS